MNISYNWLKQYLNIDIETQALSEILTNTGLEVGGVEKFQSIKGGLEGLVIGEVLTCEPHPNSDHLNLTTVNIGSDESLPIVCGASNVGRGQKVVVATVGTILYDGDESFIIKKSKIRGEVSLGMICAEDEIGVGTGHDGIMVLPEDVAVGTLAKDYFNVETDVIFEIDLTPNRIDGGSHIGVARDVAAFLKQTQDIDYVLPDVSSFSVDNTSLNISVEVENPIVCPRYAGVTVSGVKVQDSPDWLKNRLKSIGLAPINNIVDVTNFVLHELGQPLHAFDANKIKGNKVVVKSQPTKTKFTTLDEVERELHPEDLMICNAEQPMCIAGVFGGSESGVSDSTNSIFLESAYFNPVSVRKTARRHGLNTDASFRFERGVDPNMVVLALKRAAILIKELAGGKISSDIVDLYPEPIADFKVKVRYSQINRLIGVDLNKETVKSILQGLEIEIIEETESDLLLNVPAYRVDVQREADIIEEILRIYGYNTVPIYDAVNSTLSYADKPDMNKLRNMSSDQLASMGFNEAMNNSLTKVDYYEELESLKKDNLVKILNPLSNDLSVMRQTLLFGTLENIVFNANRQNASLKLFEFGNCYFMNPECDSENNLDKYSQTEHLSIAISGNRNPEMWNAKTEPISFYYLKAAVDNVLEKLGLDLNKIETEGLQDELYADGLILYYNKKEIGRLGLVAKKICRAFESKQDVYFAELEWTIIAKIIKKHKVEYKELSKFPEVRRDLSLLLNTAVKFNDIKQQAFKSEKKLLKKVSLFDVYEGSNLAEGKKSYGLSFILLDETKTLKDKQIDKIMNNMIRTFEKEFGAKLR